MQNAMPKDERISLRTPLELKEMFHTAAALSNLSMTDFLLTAGRKAAEQVLADSRRIQLDQQEWGRFMDLLDNPPAPNQNLQAAMQRHQHLLDD